MKWENLSKLVAIVKDDLEEWGHFITEIDFGLDER
jgi:hypothetical protein